MTSPEWDDQRLTAAFVARGAVRPPAPPDLVGGTMARVRRIDRPNVSRRRRWTTRLATMAAAVALVIAGAGIASRAQLSPATSPSPDDRDLVAQAAVEYGLTPMTVAQAVAVRDGGSDDRELLVSGFLANDPRSALGGSGTIDGCASMGGPSFLSPACTPRLMADPESIATRTASGVAIREPTGPWIQPAFPIVPAPRTRDIPLDAPAIPTRIAVTGHFADRRQAACEIAAPGDCGETFVVDRIVSVDGSAPQVQNETPGDEEAITRIRAAVPGLAVLSSWLVPRSGLSQLEPGLDLSAGLPEIGADAFWVVTGLDAATTGGSDHTARTFLVGHGGGGVIEMTPVGPILRAPTGSQATVAPPTTELPREVDGLDVISVSGALTFRAPGFSDRELAVHGWYVTPPRIVGCPMIPADIKPLAQRCQDGFAWLMQDAERLTATSDPTSERHPPSGPALNPIIRPDVPFEIPDSWWEAPVPHEVVVLGHFNDRRATTATERESFVVDALVWTADGPTPRQPVVRRVTPTETVDAVRARVEAALGPSASSWLTATLGASLREIDPDAAQFYPELSRAPVLWVVRRLVTDPDPTYGGSLSAIQTVYTPDGETNRIWTARSGCCTLAPEQVVELPDAGERVAIVDVANAVIEARPDPEDSRSWSAPTEGWGTQIAQGDQPNELAIRWLGGACDRTWELTVTPGNDDIGFAIDLSVPFIENCVGARATHALVLTFDRPIDLALVVLPENLSGG